MVFAKSRLHKKSFFFFLFLFCSFITIAIVIFWTRHRGLDGANGRDLQLLKREKKSEYIDSVPLDDIPRANRITVLTHEDLNDAPISANEEMIKKLFISLIFPSPLSTLLLQSHAYRRSDRLPSGQIV